MEILKHVVKKMKLVQTANAVHKDKLIAEESAASHPIVLMENVVVHKDKNCVEPLAVI
jgi:hypothetical protein